eukprot:14652559-Alexandrium_andersonii.AAC.1
MRGTASPCRATPRPARAKPLRRSCRSAHSSRGPRTRSPAPHWQVLHPVSYTHLTLPTICSV